MAFSSSSSSSDNEVLSCSKACSKTYAQLHSQYDKLTVEFRKSQINVLSYQAGTFMPPKPDLVFHTAPIAVETDHSAFTVKLNPSEPTQDLSHTNRPSAPNIEEWVSHSEDESETTASQIAPSFVQSTDPSLKTSNSPPKVTAVKAPVVSAAQGLESVEARLVVYKQNESILEENINMLKNEVQARDTVLVTLKQKLNLVEQERDDLKLKFNKFQSSSRNLTELLASQTNDKHGLGYFSSESDESWPLVLFMIGSNPVMDKYVAEILRKFRLIEGKSASTPIDTEKPLLKDPDGEDVDVHTYRSMIGSLMYLTSSRPDIMFAVCACARFQVTPKASHLHVGKRIFRYLKGKPNLGLWYPKNSPFDLVAYSDNDYPGASQGQAKLGLVVSKEFTL
nr:hypothetical protein [Tanacetum cinerariifolium]